MFPLRWLLMASRWARNPPPMGRVILVAGVVLACLAIAGVQHLGFWPDWLTAAPRRGPRILH